MISINKVYSILMYLILGCSTVFSQKKQLIHEEIMPNLENALLKQDNKEMLNWVNKLYLQDTILPDDGAYFLGFVLYSYDKPVESKEAFLRYIDLTQESGKYFESTVELVHQIDKTLGKEESECDICKILGPLPQLDTCNICQGIGKNEAFCSNCLGNGKEVCPVCSGTGFERDPFGLQVKYTACKTCGTSGVLTCTLCKGTKKQIEFCDKCNGNGITNKERTCTHKKETNTFFYR